MKYQTTKGIGWRDITPIRAFLRAYKSIQNEVYEIENCLRTMSIVEMRDSLREAVALMDANLNEIGDDDTIIEKKN
jgi:hypothetical protein